MILRMLALVEATSFLLLLCGAMPLKYLAGQPLAVQFVGWIHGVLFVAFVGMLLYTAAAARWPIGRVALVFVASLLPFGPFAIDRRMLNYAAEYLARVRSTGKCPVLRTGAK